MRKETMGMIRTREKKDAQMKNGTHQFTQENGMKVKKMRIKMRKLYQVRNVEG